MKRACIAFIGSFWLTSTLVAQELLIAVAANFAAPAQEIASAFDAETSGQTKISLGATGLLYAQIAQGAPFDVFLAADQARPDQAVAAGLAFEDSQTTYAWGRLALFSVTLDPGPDILRHTPLSRLAIANPATAPFGVAALEVLDQLNIQPPYPFTILRGANAGQAFQFTVTGNAEAGFVSLSHALTAETGRFWIVPQTMHRPIAQDAVVLRRSRVPADAQAFVQFLSSPPAAAIIEKYGYGLAVSG